MSSHFEFGCTQWVRSLSARLWVHTNSLIINEFAIWVQPQLSAKLWVHTNSLIINEFVVWVRLHSMSSQSECSWVRDSFRSLCLRKYLTQRYGLRILIWVIQLNLESAESDQIPLNFDSADSQWLILQNQTRIYWILISWISWDLRSASKNVGQILVGFILSILCQLYVPF